MATWVASEMQAPFFSMTESVSGPSRFALNVIEKRPLVMTVAAPGGVKTQV